MKILIIATTKAHKAFRNLFNIQDFGEGQWRGRDEKAKSWIFANFTQDVAPFHPDTLPRGEYALQSVEGGQQVWEGPEGKLYKGWAFAFWRQTSRRLTKVYPTRFGIYDEAR